MNKAKDNEAIFSIIVVAAGTGSRMQSSEHKQFLKLGGKPVLEMTLRAFEEHAMVGEIILVSHPAEVNRVMKEIIEPGEFKKVKKVIPGGDTRTDSVKKGLRNVSRKATYVAVHDGARPLITKAMLDGVFAQAMTSGAAILATRVTDTIKETDEKGKVIATIPRNSLWMAQTPQVFAREWIEVAYKNLPQNASVTDDAAVLEAAGYSVYTVECSKDNMKITVPSDLFQAEMILKGRRQQHANRHGL